MGKLFGTDGVRGRANIELTCELAMNIGRAAAMVLQKREPGKKQSVLIGSDTRLSADMLVSAMTAGLCSGGVNVCQVGVVSTPAVAYLVTRYGMDAGVMISASHNPFEDNGIKIFSKDGFKLSDAQEEEIEEILLAGAFEAVEGDRLGTVTSLHHRAVSDYEEYLLSTTDQRFDGLRILLDCANGSASSSAREIFTRLGAQVTVLNESPNGVNINNGCGSTHMEALQQLMRQKACYDLALAFDGDADRCLALDHEGTLVDGDKIIAICAKHFNEQGRLKDHCAVVTIMSNLGFFRFAKKNGIRTEITKVGDRYVLEAMVKNGWGLGGEQSGHVIFRDYMTTGDGQLSGVQLVSVMCREKKSLKELAAVMEYCPQVLKNLRTTREKKELFEQSPEVENYLEQCRQQMGEDGRMVIRASGTEPLIRIMLEGSNPEEIEKKAQEIHDHLEEMLECLAQKVPV